MLNLDRLLLLQELHRRGSVIAVGESLSFSPSTVSHQLKVLEREVGAALTERVGRGIRLTREGEILAEHAVRIFGEVERAEAAVAAVRSAPAGDVRVAALQTASLALLPRAIEALERRSPHPRTFVSRIEPGRALGALAAREFDIVIGEEYPGLVIAAVPGVERRPLVEDPLVLASPAGRAGAIVAGDPDALPWVMEPQGSHARSWCLAMCRRLGVEPEVRYESDDLLVQLRLVETGHAIAILPKLLLDSEGAAVGRTALPGCPTRSVFTAHRTGSDQIPAVRAVLDALAEAASAAGGREL
ncbi:LysR family transcriptional regulator [Microbacterium sp. 1.5R]|uniref:LysR family transcriptional regulator n=1 Tax=Microbacterium sp. 1.5R TaxID=1916917 RepID=UPI0011A2CBCE|nr:LysR family transcriptional regulator [Microbacterium sp. 1.5R]